MRLTVIKPHERREDRVPFRSSVVDDRMHNLIPIVLMYRNLQDKAEIFVEQLKESLSRVLVPFYPFAGRWLKDKVSGKRMLVSEDEGVPFYEVDIDQELDHVLDVNNLQLPLPSLSFYEASNVNLSTVTILPETEDELIFPSLVVQVTRFKCSGVVLSPTFYHPTCDGAGMADFLTAWGELSRKGDVSFIPCHDRSMMPSTWEVNGYHKESEEFPLDALSPSHAEEVVPKTSQKLLHVKQQAVDDMKKEATNNGNFVTTMDCITAHFWRCLSKTAKELEGTDLTACCTTVNGRRRLINLPDHYSGNVIVHAVTPNISESNLSKLSSASAAHLVNKNLQQLTPASLPALLAASAEMAKNVSCRKWRSFLITSWSAFKIYVDFGFGSPSFVFINVVFEWNLFPLGGCLVLPPYPGASEAAASVQLFMPQKYFDVLSTDPEYHSLFLASHE